MELTDSVAVAALIASQEFMTGDATIRPSAVPIRKRPARCCCGTCARCLDNAKWERVFRKKVEYPDYYRHISSRRGSSLSWL